MTPPFLRLAGVTRRYHGQGGIEDVSLTVSAGESVVLVGPERIGKDHASPACRRPRASGRRRDLARRADRRRAGTQYRPRSSAPGRFRLSGSGAVAASHGLRKCRLRSALRPVWRQRNGHRRSTAPFDCAESIRCWPGATPTSSRVENNSASRSHARWSALRVCCCWTSRFPASIATYASRFRASSRLCDGSFSSRRSTSRTIPTTPKRWRTGQSPFAARKSDMMPHAH